MLAIFFTIAGLYMILKSKFPHKKSIKERQSRSKNRVNFIIPLFLSYILKLIPESQ